MTKPTDSEQLYNLAVFIVDYEFQSLTTKYSSRQELVRKYTQMITAFIAQRDQQRLTFDPFDYVQPCEPECSPERHAYHEGQWDVANRITAALGPDNSKIEE